MSAHAESSTCSTCGGAAPAGARFCPACGSRLAEAPSEVRRFGSPPPGALLVGIALAAAAAVLTFALGRWILGAVATAVGLGLVAAYAQAVRPPRRGTSRAAAVRARGRAVVEELAVRSELRRELARLRAERERLRAERSVRLHELGEAVYADDETGTAEARAALGELDERIAAKEEEMRGVAERAQERVAGARLESRSTVLLEPPAPPGEPEPAPPPVPEPYPPPDEGTPPVPEPVPEPYPPPDEGDPPRLP